MSNTARILIVVAIASAAVGASVALHQTDSPISTLEKAVSDAGVMAPVVYVALYAIAAILLVPGTLFALLGGLLFGPLWGVLWNLLGATVGANLSFLIARYAVADWVEKKSGPKLQALVLGVNDEGWRLVAFARLVPIFPFNVLNYALGLTRISAPVYASVSAICMLPGTAVYTYIGYIGKEAAAGTEDLLRLVVIALALVASALFIPRIIFKHRRRRLD